MDKQDVIQVFEHGWLIAGQKYGPAKDVLFSDDHFRLLARYLTEHPGNPYYTVYLDRVKFSGYVGMLRVAGLSIEVLPKTDRHQSDKALWQDVLLRMLLISLDVKARTTTTAAIQVRRHSVLETYLHLFLEEVRLLQRQGLLRRYRQAEGNHLALKGKLLLHRHLRENAVHAERFYVAYTVYDRDNVYNRILHEALRCIQRLRPGHTLNAACGAVLLDFPECSPLRVSPTLFERLTYDRKTLRYQRAIELARIILLNFHPDVKGGRDNLLAIMFDMNQLWESYIGVLLQRARKSNGTTYTVEAQRPQQFWRHPDNWQLHLIPDFVVTNEATKEKIIIDTKWKYDSGTSADDVRQLYAYGNYFGASRRFLLYPDKLPNDAATARPGPFFDTLAKAYSVTESCGVVLADLLFPGNTLNESIGAEILKVCFEKK